MIAAKSRTLVHTDLVVDDNALYDGLVKHLLVPVLKPLGLGYLHVGWMAVEDIVVTFARWTRPDVCHRVAAISHQYQLISVLTT